MNGKDSSDDCVWVLPGKTHYSLREKIRMAVWWLVEALLFQPSLHKMHRWRRFLLQLFGAKLAAGASVDAKARIWFPWNLEMGEDSGIGFDALIYMLAKVTIGKRASIAQRVHINTGSRDYRDTEFGLITRPVSIGAGAFIGTDVYIGLGVSIGKLAVVGARSVVIKDLPAEMVCYGHPCAPVKPRVPRGKGVPVQS